MVCGCYHADVFKAIFRNRVAILKRKYRLYIAEKNLRGALRKRCTEPGQNKQWSSTESRPRIPRNPRPERTAALVCCVILTDLLWPKQSFWKSLADRNCEWHGWSWCLSWLEIYTKVFDYGGTYYHMFRNLQQVRNCNFSPWQNTSTSHYRNEKQWLKD